jgi:anti-anti-sigma regulatory factor
MDLGIAIISGVAVYTVHAKRLVRSNCDPVRRAAQNAVDFSRPFVMDFSGVEDLDTAGLSLLLHWLAEARRFGGKATFCSNSPQFRALAELVRISSTTAIHTSLREALDVCLPSEPRSITITPGHVPRSERSKAATVGSV